MTKANEHVQRVRRMSFSGGELMRLRPRCPDAQRLRGESCSVPASLLSGELRQGERVAIGGFLELLAHEIRTSVTSIPLYT